MCTKSIKRYVSLLNIDCTTVPNGPYIHSQVVLHLISDFARFGKSTTKGKNKDLITFNEKKNE